MNFNIVLIILLVTIFLIPSTSFPAFAIHENDFDSQCRENLVLIYRINSNNFVCTSQETAHKWIQYGIAEDVVSESSTTRGDIYEDEFFEGEFIGEEFIEESTQISESSDIFPSDTVDYTILMYVVGSDLESQWFLATKDFQEMIQGDPNDSINVIIESGGSKAKPEGERTIDFTTVQRLQIKNGDIHQLDNLGNQNMGLSKTLTDFLDWGTSSFPAENYVLILWNHGSGVNGYGHDEINHDLLSLDELENALDAAKNKNNVTYEIIGFDACLMATIEVANILKDYANYMVASEELEVGDGWKYDEIIASLNDNSKQSGAELGKVIADSFFADTKAKSTGNYDLSRATTLSVIDLGAIPALNESINLLTSKIENDIDKTDMPKFSVSLRDSERYGIDSRGEDSGHMDIRHFSDNVSEYLPQFQGDSDKVKQDLDNAVIYSVKGSARPQANGLSIYMPTTSDAVSTNYRSATSSTSVFYADYLNQDTISPTQNLQLINQTIIGTYSGDDVYEIKTYFTTEKSDYDLIQIIATDEFDPDEAEYGFTYGEVNFTWDKYLPSLCNDEICVPVNPEWEWGDPTNLAYIPVSLESDGIISDVDLLYDITVDDGEVFMGAYPHTQEGIFEKNILIPQSGDKVIVYKEINHFDSKQSLFIQNKNQPIIVDDDFGFVWEIFEGTFYIVIEICDFSGNCSYSDFFEYTVTNDDLEE